MLLIQNVSKSYRSKAFVQQALTGVTFELPSKGMVFITGKSGSGKSTLLNILSGIDKPDEGKVLFYGKPLDPNKEKNADDYRRSVVSFIFQSYNLIGTRTVYENIALTAELQGRKADVDEIMRVLDWVGMKRFALTKADELSAGQMQRVAIARALYKQSKVIFADELTGDLDRQNAQEIFELLKKESEKILVVVVTQDKQSAEKYGDRIIELSDGEITADTQINKHEITKEGNAEPAKRGSFCYLAINSLSFVSVRQSKTALSFLLSLFASVFFGLGIVALSVSPFDIVLNSLNRNNIGYVYLENKTSFMEKTYEGDAFSPMYKNSDPQKQSHENEKDTLFYADYIVEASEYLADSFELLYNGAFPEDFTEIALSDYIAKKTVERSNGKYSTPADLIGVYFYYCFVGVSDLVPLRVAGIIKTQYNAELKGREPLGDCLFSHYFVKKGFSEQYRKQAFYCDGAWILKYNEKQTDINDYQIDKLPYITTITNPTLIDNDIMIYVDSGFVDSRDLTLTHNEVLININQYNRLFGTKDSFLTTENIEAKRPRFGQTITCDYYDGYTLEAATNMQLTIKGVIFDSANEPFDKNGKYNNVAICPIISEDLFICLTRRYKLPAKYLVDLSASNVKTIFSDHYSLGASADFSDHIVTKIDIAIEISLSKLDRTKYLFIMLAIILAVFSVLLTYNNLNNNIEKNMRNIGILRSFGMSKNNVLIIFFLENVLSLLLLLPASFIGIWLIISELNKNFSTASYILKVLNFTPFNTFAIFAFIIIVALCSILLPLIRLFKKTPRELIRQNNLF